MRVAIVGGGLIGCAVARELAQRHVDVVVLDRGGLGSEASSAAAGILGAQLESHAPGALADAFVRARAAHARWSEELREETGLDVGYRVPGALRVTTDPYGGESLERAVAWQRTSGLRAELLEPETARRIEPSLGPEVRAAAFFPDEAEVDPPALVRAVIASAARAGATLCPGTNVRALAVDGDSCGGVVTDDGRIDADRVVIAAGAWSSSFAVDVPELACVGPVRGQIVLLEERPPALHTIVMGDHGYVVPRGDGRVVCGATEERVGFRRGVTASGIRQVLEGAMRLAPSLGDATIAATWSNFRPWAAGAEGDEPLVRVGSLPGTVLATGHYRNGILLAKTTADRVVELLGLA